MNWFHDLITNPFLLTALSAWFIAQLLKTILNAYDMTQPGISGKELIVHK